MIYELNSFLSDCVINNPEVDNMESLSNALEVFLDGNGYGEVEASKLHGMRLVADVVLSPDHVETFIIKYHKGNEYPLYISHGINGDCISDEFKIH